MDHKTLLLGMNTLRAIEANARISKVLFNGLQDVSPAFEKELGTLNLHQIGQAVDRLIEAADAVHKNADRLHKDTDIQIPPDDADGVILVPQCCGTK